MTNYIKSNTEYFTIHDRDDVIRDTGVVALETGDWRLETDDNKKILNSAAAL